MQYSLSYTVEILDDNWIEFSFQDELFDGLKFKIRLTDEQLTDCQLACEYAAINDVSNQDLIKRLIQLIIPKLLEKVLNEVSAENDNS